MIPLGDSRFLYFSVGLLVLFVFGNLMVQAGNNSRCPSDAKNGPPNAQSTTEMDVTDIKRVLTEQAEAWNRGDIDSFMEHYWKSDKLTFSSGGKTTRGWATTKQNYKKRYPTREQMGKLTFNKLEFLPLGESAALVLGQCRLERKEPVGGNFSLVFRKIDGRWLIIHDHTSVAEKPE